MRGSKKPLNGIDENRIISLLIEHENNGTSRLVPYKRIFDLFVTIFLVGISSFFMIIIIIIIKLTTAGPVLYWSDRIGKDNIVFRMPKFRTMKVGTPVVATHLLTSPENYLTSIGRFLRKLSLDELPQLFSVLEGNMSLVGPRPALFNQEDLIELRTKMGIHELTPGITGWAQINGRDELPIPKKVILDRYYLRHQSLLFDLKTLCLTIWNVSAGKGIQH